METVFPISQIRDKFPILNRKVNGYDLIYFDNAATSQKPQMVIDALTHYYQNTNSNVHRGIHTLSEEATQAFEATRQLLVDKLNAESREQIIYTRGTTEAINLVANSYGEIAITANDEVLITQLEHHSNIVPWQLLCQRKGAKLRYIPVLDNGTLDYSKLDELINNRTKIVALNHISNTMGTINQIQLVIEKAHSVGAVVLVDGAQATPHLSIDVRALDVDFYACSAHKMYGPTGIGCLYAKTEHLLAMPPYQGGGEMIATVTLDQSTWAELPYKFEAGTPNIADAIAWKAAYDFVSDIGIEKIAQYENELLAYATPKLLEIDGLKIIGTAPYKSAVISFVIDGVHHQDLGIMLDRKGIAVRTGHHCTQPLMQRFGISGTTRVSFAVYNSIQEIDFFVEQLKSIVKKLR